VTKLEQNIKCFSTIQKFAGFQDNKSWSVCLYYGQKFNFSWN
jgi:hypothetical protein